MIGDLPKLRSGLSKELDNSENWAKAIRREYSSLLKGHVTEGLFLSDLVGEIGKLSASPTRGSHFVSNCDGPELQACSTLAAPKIPDVMKWVSDERLNGFIGHSTRGHMASDLARYLFCAAYAQNSNKKKPPKLEDWSSVDLLPDHANVRGETDNFGEVKIKVETHSDRFRVQVWDSPSTTVVSHISKDGQYHQVGNAVPPYLAKQIAERIFQFLDVSYSSVDSKMCIEQEPYDSSLSGG
jgi:DNA (cytosine-5)-methyltransferase 1